MMCNSPGIQYREGLTLVQVIEKFGSGEAAAAWFEERLWPQESYCPHWGR